MLQIESQETFLRTGQYVGASRFRVGNIAVQSGEMLRQACVSVGAALVAGAPSVLQCQKPPPGGAEVGTGFQRHLVGCSKVFTMVLVDIVTIVSSHRRRGVTLLLKKRSPMPLMGLKAKCNTSNFYQYKVWSTFEHIICIVAKESIIE